MPLYGLTPTEATVCGLLAEGRSVAEIQDQLGITANTARTHVKRILAKTGAARQSDRCGCC